MFKREISLARTPELQHHALKIWLQMHDLRGSLLETLQLVDTLLGEQHATAEFSCPMEYIGKVRALLKDETVRAGIEKEVHLPAAILPDAVLDSMFGASEADSKCRGWQLATCLLV